MNNLLERFHQSFFFYFLINRRAFVSIATYMVPLGLMVLPAIIRCLVLYMSFFRAPSNSSQTYITHGRTMNFRVEYGRIFREMIECFIISYAMTWVPINVLTIALGLTTMFISPFFLSPLRSTEHEFDYFQFLLLLAGCALLGCLSLLNYSLAFLVACFLMPCYFIAGASKFNHWFAKSVSRFLFITVLNPLVFLILYHYLAQLIKAGTFVLPNFVQFSMDLNNYFASYRLFNVWTADVLCLTVVPLWLLLYRSTYWFRMWYTDQNAVESSIRSLLFSLKFNVDILLPLQFPCLLFSSNQLVFKKFHFFQMPPNIEQSPLPISFSSTT